MMELPSGFVFKLVDALLEALYGLLETFDSALGSGFKCVSGYVSGFVFDSFSPLDPTGRSLHTGLKPELCRVRTFHSEIIALIDESTGTRLAPAGGRPGAVCVSFETNIVLGRFCHPRTGGFLSGQLI
jgi:hypothetical protein